MRSVVQPSLDASQSFIQDVGISMAAEPEPEEHPKKLENDLSAKKLTRQMAEHTNN